MTKVSIIIATYNSSSTIRAALESVRTQTFRDWECLVVDGASKDDTIAIVKEYCEKDERFRYVSEKDNGIYDAFNKGWRMDKGEWVHYLGSDDRLTKDGMEKVAIELDDHFAIVTGDVYLHRVDGTERLQEYHGFFGCHQGVLMKRDAFQMLNGFNEQYRILADYELMVRVKKSGNKVKNVRAAIAYFTMGGESQQLQSQWKKMWERYLINKRHGVKRHPLASSMLVFFRHSAIGLYRSLRYKFL